MKMIGVKREVSEVEDSVEVVLCSELRLIPVRKLLSCDVNCLESRYLISSISAREEVPLCLEFAPRRSFRGC